VSFLRNKNRSTEVSSSGMGSHDLFDASSRRLWPFLLCAQSFSCLEQGNSASGLRTLIDLWQPFGPATAISMSKPE